MNDIELTYESELVTCTGTFADYTVMPAIPDSFWRGIRDMDNNNARGEKWNQHN